MCEVLSTIKIDDTQLTLYDTRRGREKMLAGVFPLRPNLGFLLIMTVLHVCNTCKLIRFTQNQAFNVPRRARVDPPVETQSRFLLVHL